MKKQLVILLFSMALVFSAAAQDQIVVDANATMRQLTGSFSKIKVSNGIDIFLSQSDNESLAVSASEEKYIDNIVTVVEGNTLSVFYNGNKSWRGNRKMKVYISFKAIDELEASGASAIVVAGTIVAPKLHLKLSGASDFAGSVKTDDLEMDLSGASGVKINGVATNVNIENSGASDVKGYGLSTDVCTTKSSGASDVNITVNKELNVNASGASDVYYKGNAVVKNYHSSGASTVAKKEDR